MHCRSSKGVSIVSNREKANTCLLWVPSLSHRTCKVPTIVCISYKQRKEAVGDRVTVQDHRLTASSLGARIQVSGCYCFYKLMFVVISANTRASRVSIQGKQGNEVQYDLCSGCWFTFRESDTGEFILGILKHRVI